MRKLLLTLAFCLASSASWAQCTGVFPAKTLCGNLGATAAPPAAFTATGTIGGSTNTTSGDIAVWGNTTGTLLYDPPSITTSQALTFSGTTSFAGVATFNAVTNFTSQFQINGIRIQFPTGPDTVGGLATSQSWTGTNSFTALNATGLTSLANVQLNQVATVSPFSVGNGGTGNATAAAHSIPINEGVAAQANTTTGSLGQCVNSNGASADPTFTSGCWSLVSTTIATSGAASISDTTHINANFNYYELTVDNCTPVTTGVTLILLDFANGGVATSNYVDSTFQTITQTNATSTSAIELSSTGQVMTNVTSGWSGTLRLGGASSGNQRTWSGIGGYQEAAGTMATVLLSGVLSASSVITGYQLQFTGGNVAACTAKLYGRL